MADAPMLYVTLADGHTLEACSFMKHYADPADMSETYKALANIQSTNARNTSLTQSISYCSVQ